jgi:hypothetical protein
MLSFHHNQSDLHALVNGDGSAPYTHWNEGFVNKYSQMRGEATCHVMDAKKEWAEVALLRERAESATNEVRPSEADGFRKQAGKREAQLERDADEFMGRHVVSLRDHFDELRSVYSQKMPPRDQDRPTSSAMSQQTSQGHQTTRQSNVSKRDGCRSLIPATTRSRLGIAEAKPY